jgi:pyruvate,orthophosphate dikinase
MLGHRGCRLAISYPEIAEMQARAIFEAAIDAAAETDEPVVLEIMVPLVATRAELDLVNAMIENAAGIVERERGQLPAYSIGTMIELPRAAIEAGRIAETAEFFSFGTNDLTQTTFGISRDDAATFLGIYTMRGDRARLRLLLTLPCPDSAAGCGPGRAEGKRRRVRAGNTIGPEIFRISDVRS